MSPPVFATSAGSSRGDQSAAGSRLSGHQRRRAPTRWWTICLRGPRNTEPYLWTALGRGPESPANPGYAETHTSLLFPLLLCVSLLILFPLSLSGTQAFFGGGYRLGAAPEEESAYVAGERQASNSQQDVSTI